MAKGFLDIFGYLSSWLLMLLTIWAALLAEGIHTYLSSKKMQSRRGAAVTMIPLRDIFRSMTRPISLPEDSAIRLSLYLPPLALAALVPISASIPYFSFVPLMENGGDLMQILQFAIFSETLAIISVYSLGTEGSAITAERMMKELVMLIVPMCAAFVSIAFFYSASGTQGDPFSLNVFTQALHTSASTPAALTGTMIFIFVIFSQIPHSNVGFGCLLLENCELPDFSGAPRSMLQLWSILRAFLVVALVTHIFYPWGYFKTLNAEISISWWAQSLNFVLFWLVVILVRVFGITLCWKMMSLLKKISKKDNFETWLCIILTVAATLLVVYEGIKISVETAAF